MKIICYGDSNTYGYDGDEVFGGRFPAESRWPELLGRMLGCAVANCGLNGRRVPRFQRNVDADLALLRRNGDCAWIVVMLGTNDILCEADPEDTASCMRRFLEELRRALPESAVLLCAPPPVTMYGDGYAQNFKALAQAYRKLAEELSIPFVDTADWQIPTGGDGVHFSERGHRIFAARIGQLLRAMMR